MNETRCNVTMVLVIDSTQHDPPMAISVSLNGTPDC